MATRLCTCNIDPVRFREAAVLRPLDQASHWMAA